jgi:tetratricopeptide (TPR) repeat protein
MANSDTFGELLKSYRKRTKNPLNNHKALSQKQFAEELGFRENLQYSYGSISGWERNAIPIDPSSRLLLKTIIKILLHFKGLDQLAEANELLRLGDHPPLTNSEVNEIHGRWQQTTSTAQSFRIASKDIQRAALPIQIKLQGKEEAFLALNIQLSNPAGLPLVYIIGRGGIGKSALTTALARHHLDQNFFDSVAWIPLNFPDDQSTEDVVESFTISLGRRLEIRHFDETTAAGHTAQIRGALEAKPHLIVLDGIESPIHCEALNHRLRSIVGRSKFLVTSRAAPQNTESAYVYKLDEIDVDNCQKLLQEHSKKTGGIPAEQFTLEVAKQIHACVGGHPLTLVLFPQLLKQHSLDILLQAIELGIEGKHEYIYARVWEMLSPNAQKLVWVLCFFGTLGTEEASLKTISGLDTAEHFKATGELGRFGLLQVRGGLNDKTYNLHSLTIQYVQILYRKTLDADGQQDFVLVTGRVFKYWQELFANPLISLPYELVLKLQLTLSFSQIIQSNPIISQQRCQLLYTIFTPLKNHDFLNSWEPFWKHALINDVDADDLFMCRLMNQLAYIKQEQRDFETALTLHEEALKLGFQLEETLEIAQAYHHMSWCYYRMSRFDLASKYNLLAVKLFEEFGISNEDYIKSLLRRGILAMNQEKFDSAENSFLQVIDYLKNTNQHQHLIQAFHNLGYLYYLMNQYSPANEAYENARKYLQLFPNKIKNIRILLAQSALRFEHNHLEKAISSLQSIDLDFLRDTQNHDLLYSTLNNMAVGHMKQKEYSKAEVLIFKLLSYREERNQRYEYLLLRETYAELLSQKGDSQAGLVVLENALAELKTLPQEIKVTKLIKDVELRISNSGQELEQR